MNLIFWNNNLFVFCLLFNHLISYQGYDIKVPSKFGEKCTKAEDRRMHCKYSQGKLDGFTYAEEKNWGKEYVILL